MKQYKYLELGWDHYSRLLATSTDPAVLDWIEAEAKRVCPRAQLKEEETFDFSPSGERFHVSFSDVHEVSWWGAKQSRAHHVFWWLVRLLCQQGWEPIGTGTDTLSVLQLRIAEDVPDSQGDTETACSAIG